jgi:hypothetical protein
MDFLSSVDRSSSVARRIAASDSNARTDACFADFDQSGNR